MGAIRSAKPKTCLELGYMPEYHTSYVVRVFHDSGAFSIEALRAFWVDVGLGGRV